MKELQKQESGALQPTSVYEVFAQMARDPNVDVAKLQGLMELQIKAEERHAEKLFNEAYARLLQRMPRIAKKGKIPLIKDGVNKGSIPFIKNEDMDTVLRPMYTAEGFTLSFLSEPCPSGIIRVASLRHAAGHSITSRMQLPPDKGPGRNDLQALGSSLSYADRYLTRGLFNIIALGEDDDGNQLGTITQAQAELLDRFCLTAGADLDKLLAVYGCKALSDLPAINYQGVLTQLSAKLRKKLQDEGADADEIADRIRKAQGGK